MLLTIPPLLHIPGHSYSLLGFGDIVLPGLLGVYTRTWDLRQQLSAFHSYFWPCLAGYAVGLLVTNLALYFEIGGSQGQPALLYLVPCCLGTVLVLAASRGSLMAMWRGGAYKHEGMSGDEELPTNERSSLLDRADDRTQS